MVVNNRKNCKLVKIYIQMELDHYRDEEGFKLFCIESVDDIEEQNDSQLLDFLEHLAREFHITNVYKTTDSFEGLEESLNNLLYHDNYFREYKLIYLVVEGEGNQILIDDYYYSLEEIAELFQGKLSNKIVHFANTMNLDLEDESFQYFIDVTGAKALSGYVNSSPILSTILDQYYFFSLHIQKPSQEHRQDVLLLHLYLLYPANQNDLSSHVILKMNHLSV